MNYTEQLEQPEWRKKRNEILVRDGFKCTQCQNERINVEMRMSKNIRLSLSKNTVGFMILTRSKEENMDWPFYYDIEFTDILTNKRIFGNFHTQAKIEKEIRDRVKKAVYIQFPMMPDGNTPYAFCELMDNSENVLWYNEEFYDKNLQVHHKYYDNGKLAWEYDNDVLITLCRFCHSELHDIK